MDLEMEVRLQRLIEGIKKANYKDCDKEYMARLAEERINELQQRGVNCVDRFVQKLLDRIGDKEAYLDILMEGRFAVVLARNRFSEITFIKEDRKHRLPDIQAYWNKCTVYFEVTRKRPSKDDERFSHPGAGPYWVKPAESEDIIGKIQGKLRQLKPGEINIVVPWSDTPAWNQDVLREAHKYIRQEIDDDPEKYKDLSGVLFTNGGGISYSTPKMEQFYLFENKKASKPPGLRFAAKLRYIREKSLKQLEKDREELAAALKRFKLRQSNN